MSRLGHIAHRHRRLLLLACVLLWVTLMVATHLPPERMPRTRLSDKFLHALGYFGLAAIFWSTLRAHELPGRVRVACVFFAAAAYAAVDEITQPMVGRSASLGDWAADVLGAAAALAVCELLSIALTRRPGRNTPPAP